MASLHSAFFAQPSAIHAKRLASCPSPSTVVASPHRIAISCSQAAEPSDDAKATMWSCSRRQVLGMGGMLAIGFNSLVKPLQVAAEQATCRNYNVTASGLGYCDSEVGTGITASKGMLIKAHYSGRLENGTEFDSSYQRRKPLTFRVGVGEVIRGWDQGILGTEGIPAMQAGGKRTLKIPANLGYGEREPAADWDRVSFRPTQFSSSTWSSLGRPEKTAGGVTYSCVQIFCSSTGGSVLS